MQVLATPFFIQYLKQRLTDQKHLLAPFLYYKDTNNIVNTKENDNIFINKIYVL